MAALPVLQARAGPCRRCRVTHSGGDLPASEYAVDSSTKGTPRSASRLNAHAEPFPASTRQGSNMVNNLTAAPLNDLPAPQQATQQQTPQPSDCSTEHEPKSPVMRPRPGNPDSSSGGNQGDGEPTGTARGETMRWQHSSADGSEACEIPPSPRPELNRPGTDTPISPTRLPWCASCWPLVWSMRPAISVANWQSGAALPAPWLPATP